MKWIDTNNKEILYINLLVIVVIFFVFYWTHVLVSSKIADTKSNIDSLKHRLINVQELVTDIKCNSSSPFELKKGLLAFIQQVTAYKNLSDKISNLQTVNSSSNHETVSMKLESLNLEQIIYIIKHIEQYNNLYIKHLEITKRFDDPQLADMTIQIVKNNNI